MDQVRYQTLTGVAAISDAIYILTFLLKYAVIVINGSVPAPLMDLINRVFALFKVESSNATKNRTQIGLNTTIEDGGISDEPSSVDFFLHFMHWICFPAICLLMLTQLWAAVKLLVSTEQELSDAPELALRMTRLWRNFHIVLLVLLALGFVVGYHWLDLVLHAVEPALVVTVASMFVGQLVTLKKSPV